MTSWSSLSPLPAMLWRWSAIHRPSCKRNKFRLKLMLMLRKSSVFSVNIGQSSLARLPRMGTDFTSNAFENIGIFWWWMNVRYESVASCYSTIWIESSLIGVDQNMSLLWLVELHGNCDATCLFLSSSMLIVVIIIYLYTSSSSHQLILMCGFNLVVLWKRLMFRKGNQNSLLKSWRIYNRPIKPFARRCSQLQRLGLSGTHRCTTIRGRFL